MIELLFLFTERYLVSSLPTVWFGVVMFALLMYLTLDGLDFGIGILYGTPAAAGHRETLLSAFGPIWDANEVWLVAFGTMLLAAFPDVYSLLLSEHYLIVIGFVLALVFRGVGPELRERSDNERWRQFWDRSFVAGSSLAPFLFGVLAGSWVFGTSAVSLPALLVGVAVVALSVSTGSAYLAVKTSRKLASALGVYGIVGTSSYLAGSVVLFVVIAVQDPGGTAETAFSTPVLGLLGASVVAGVAGIVFVIDERYRAWLASAAVLPVLFGILVTVLLYPMLYPAGGLTVNSAVVSPLALNLVTVLGLPVLAIVLGYFVYLYRVFSGPIEDGYGA
jgi:cytochrome d ubiquinol oxidase subunit II